MPALGEYQDLLEVARGAAIAASDLLATARPSAVRSKSNPRDLVTEWDVRTEELLQKYLAERAPGIPVLGEEGTGKGTEGAPGSMRWLVDPIDGTVNFAHGLPIWSVSIALERLPDELDQGELLVGVVAAPLVGWWFEASKGGGARASTAWNAPAQPIRVSAIESLEGALLATGFPYDIATNPLPNLDEWAHLQRVSSCRRLGSASLDACMVGCGWFDGYWERHLNAWDVGAAALVVTEAGGTITKLDGSPFDPHAGQLVATNGAIHAQLLAELAATAR